MATRHTAGTGTVGAPRRAWIAAIAVVAVAGGVVSASGSRHTSTTFDEIFMVASGARGWVTGDWSMTLDHPPVMQYLYGAAAHVAGVELPAEGRVDTPEGARPRWGAFNRFVYAQELYFNAGNDPERVAFATRLVGILLAVALVALAATLTWRIAGPLAALLAATLTAFLPDVLAHAAVSYNDVPLALVYLGGLWAWDRAIREPTLRSAALAAALSGLALGVKFSALALGAAAFVLFILEAIARGRDRSWWTRIGTLLPAAVAVAYLTLVIVYRGDFALTEFRWGIAQNIWHASVGHGVPVTLLGRTSPDGFWYFFPVALLLKTPAAFHALGILALMGFVQSWRSGRGEHGSPGTGAAGGPSAVTAPPGAVPGRRAALRSPLRPVAVGALVFLVFLVRANLNIGIRHALPLMPLLAILVAVGTTRLWAVGPRLVRAVAALLVVAFAASSLAYYPHFLTYLTEYLPLRKELGFRVMVDSNLDWGQGLLELREWMDRNEVERVYLSYFGSALPAGYGIDYVPLQSFFPLRPPPEPDPDDPEPRWLVVSGTNLAGMYLAEDPFATLRSTPPHTVLANSVYVYRIRRDPAAPDQSASTAPGSGDPGRGPGAP